MKAPLLTRTTSIRPVRLAVWARSDGLGERERATSHEGWQEWRGLVHDKRAVASGSPATAGLVRARRSVTPGEGTQLDDAALVQAAVSGDADAFSGLYQRYQWRLVNRCARIVASRDDAEDVAQEAFVRAYLKLDRFDCTRPFWPWLATIGERLAINHVSSSRSTSAEPLDRVIDQGLSSRAPDPTFTAVARREERLSIRQAIDALPASQRRPLLASAVEGLSYAHIAKEEGQSLGGIKSLIFRARTALRALEASRLWGVAAVPARSIMKLQGRLRMRARGPARWLESGAPSLAAAHPVLAVFVSLSLAVTGIVTHSPSEVISSRRSSALNRTRSLSPLTIGQRPEAARSLGALQRALSRDSMAPPPLETRGPAATIGCKSDFDCTTFVTLTASPSYHNDATVFAAGLFARCAGPLVRECYGLYVSTNGGSSWIRLPSRGLAGTQLLLPPDYPADPRLFVMTPAGLQASSDGGTTFAIVSPAPGRAGDLKWRDMYTTPVGPKAAVLSDAAGRWSIIIAGPPLTVYDPRTSVTRPWSRQVRAGSDPTIATYRLDDAHGPVVLVGGELATATGDAVSVVYRCDSSTCSTTLLHESEGAPTLRPAPTTGSDDRVYAWTTRGLFMSIDGARSFRPIEAPGRPRTGLWSDMEETTIAGWGAGTLFLAKTFRDCCLDDGEFPTVALYRSDDRGGTWSPLGPIIRGVGMGADGRLVDDASWAHVGVKEVVTTLSGRLLVLLGNGWFGCSEDGGRSWSGRCTPEDPD